MADQPTTDHDLLIRIDERVKELHEHIKGNGKAGLLDRMANLELWRSMLIGAWALVLIGIGVWEATRK